MTARSSTLVLVPLALALAACGSTDRPSPGFGDAVRHNMAAQIVNPDPHPEDMASPEMDGRRAGDALGRYREGKVKPPVSLGTSTLSTGGAKK